MDRVASAEVARRAILAARDHEMAMDLSHPDGPEGGRVEDQKRKVAP